MKRVFKIKTFDRWARKILADALLCQAAREIEQGLFEADLGAGVCKKRVALPGQGKSGSTRTLVAKKHADAVKIIAASLQLATAAQLNALLHTEVLRQR